MDMWARIICFWMRNPTHQDMDYANWVSFREVVAWWVVVVWGVATAIIVGLYILWARSRKIRTPSSLFLPYAPLQTLWLAIIPAVVLFFVCRGLHDEIVGLSWHALAMGPAVKCALWGGFLVLVSSYAFMLMPGVTPAIYRYRPIAWMLRGRVRRALAATG